jgi:hypothetical protein
MGGTRGELKGIHIRLHAIRIAPTGGERILIPTFSEGYEVGEQVPCSTAIPDIHAWAAEPSLDLHKRDRNVLGVVPVKAPKLPAGGGLRDAMTIVVKTNCFVFCLFAKSEAETAEVLVGGIKYGFVRDLETQTLKLVLKIRADGFESLMRWEGVRIDPALECCAGISLYDIWGIDVNVQTEDESRVCSLELSGCTSPPWK